VIQDVVVKPLRVIPDDRGYLMEMLRCDDPFFERFGQSYLTAAYPAVVKGWHYHKVQVDHFVCVSGIAKVVLYDRRDDSPTRGELQEFFMGQLNPILLRIPPLVLHGFTAVGHDTALIINFPSDPYDYQNPDEFRVAWNSPEVPYDWAVRNG
jgi:dTDP-4-dehydrorhamnose 3,5-epimerase